MRVLPFLFALTLSAQAAPLIQSKASVAEGQFCKTYQCLLLQRSVSFPETMNMLVYDYALNRAKLTVIRYSNMEIFSGALSVPVAQWNTPVVQDFFRNFAASTPEPSTLRACIKRAVSSGSPYGTELLRATVGGVSYSAECRAAQGGTIVLTIRDGRDLLR